MLGHQVFFPTGTHASGLPAVTFAQKIADRETTTIAQLEDHQVPSSEWKKLEDPSYAARFLGQRYLEVYRRLGLLVDESAYVTTIDDDYQSFIRWQFHRLNDLGLLGQALHFASVCPICGPVSVDPSETDLSSGGDSEWIDYVTLPFQLDDGRVLLTATLRPETVFGVTNLWLPDRESLVVWHYVDRMFLVSRAGGRRLTEQHGGRVGHEVTTPELVGRTAVAPITGARVPLFTSRLVDPKIGTGVVMSVPAHAPADWLALSELSVSDQRLLPPPPEIIEIPSEVGLAPSELQLRAGEGLPSERALRATGAKSLDDGEPLAAATERLYRLEFVRGRMRVDPFGGVSVSKAREELTEQLRKTGLSFNVQEFSKPVICRNGHEVVIRKIPDQWFLTYGNRDWKDQTRELLSRMTIRPEQYQSELPEILEWYQNRPCTRRGRWLGTPFPLDPSWIIEPIADSTFYPAYFVIRKYVSQGRVAVENLTEAFFDYVILGRGEGEPRIERSVQEEIRADFTYWYPLDVNIGGKEHKRVHFPVFLFTHVKLLPPEFQPRRIYVHWWITDRGGSKISKKEVSSKGGRVPPIRDALERWGADALRLFYANSATPFQDVEWDGALVDQAADRLEEIERMIRQLSGSGSGGTPELDRWLEAELHQALRDLVVALDAFELRDAGEIIYARIPGLFRRFLHRGGAPGGSTTRLLKIWIRALSPITPHLAEELGEGRFPDLVAVQPFPSPDDLAPSPDAISAERFLDQVEEDLQSVLRPAEARGERPKAVSFFVAPPWKRTLEAWLRESIPRSGSSVPMREIIDRAKNQGEMSAYLSEIPKYVQRIAPFLRSEGTQPLPPVDELHLLKQAEGYLARRFQFEEIGVYPEELGEEHDPHNRRDRARPGRPAFYLIPREPRPQPIV
jgi:leucyl-tRNA synthetase